MATKKFDEKYMEYVEKKLHDVMFSEPAAQDYTQFCLSLRNATLAAATIYGSSTDEQKHQLYEFVYELLINHIIPNIEEWDINYKKKEENGDNE